MTDPAKAVADERALVRAVVARGDEKAFRLLYRRHTPMLLRMATRLTGDAGPVAEELVHDAWIRASEGLADFAWRSSLGTWLGGILVNCVRGRWRTLGRRSEVPFDDVAFAAAATPEDLDARLDLETAIARLPEGYRTAVVLHDIEGMTHEDIARLLEIDVGTSKSQLSRARRHLRRWLDPAWGVAT